MRGKNSNGNLVVNKKTFDGVDLFDDDAVVWDMSD